MGETATHHDRPSSFVARDIVALPADVRIQGAASLVVQRADSLDVGVDQMPFQSNNSSNWF